MPFSSQVQRSLNHITDGIRRMPERSGFIIKEVIFNDPVTVVNWADGKKTIVRCQEGDTYDKRTGLLLCIAKRVFGNKGRYNDVLNKWCPEEDPQHDPFKGFTCIGFISSDGIAESQR